MLREHCDRKFVDAYELRRIRGAENVGDGVARKREEVGGGGVRAAVGDCGAIERRMGLVRGYIRRKVAPAFTRARCNAAVAISNFSASMSSP